MAISVVPSSALDHVTQRNEVLEFILKSLKPSEIRKISPLQTILLIGCGCVKYMVLLRHM